MMFKIQLYNNKYVKKFHFSVVFLFFLVMLFNGTPLPGYTVALNNQSDARILHFTL